MTDTYPETLLDFVLRATIGDRDRIGMSAVASARIPQGIKAFLRADVQRRVREDAAPTRYIRNLLDAGGGTPGDAVLDALVGGFVFDAGEYRTITGHAVHFLGNYLSRPQTTLREFIYHDRGSADAATIRERLDHCTDHPYLLALIRKYMERRNIRELSVEAFGILVERMDALFLQRLSAEDHVRLTLPLFEYYEYAGERESGAPAQSLKAFFAEKHLDDLAEAVTKAGGEEDQARVTFARLMTAVRGEPPAGGEGWPPSRRREEEEQPAAGTPAAQPESGSAGPDPGDPVPYAEPPAQPPARNQNLGNAALALTYAGLEKPSVLPPLESLMTPAQREVFVRKVFHKDPDYFGAVLKALNRVNDWDEAADYLRRLYDTIGLDPFQEDVVRFTDVVHSRYTGGRS